MADFGDMFSRQRQLLLGESVFQSPCEWSLLVKLILLAIFSYLLMKVRPVVQKQIKLRRSKPPVDRQKIAKEVSYIKDKLQMINCQLNKCSVSVEYIQEHYPRWQLIREMNIKTLKQIADSIENDRENCNVTRVAGGVASIIGGGITLAFSAHPMTAFIGAIITQLGSLTSAGASAIEMALLHADIKKAKTTVNEDRVYFNGIWSKLMDSSKLMEDVNEILDIDIWEKIKIAAAEFLPITQGARKSRFFFFRKKEDKKEFKEKNETDLNMQAKKMIFSFKNLPLNVQNEAVEVVEILMSFLILRERNHYLFELASHAKKIIPRLTNLTKNLLVIFASCSKLQKRGNLETISNSAVMIGMILDAILIADSASDIQKGSLSNESKAIRQAAEILGQEADILKGLYSLAVRDNFSVYNNSY